MSRLTLGELPGYLRMLAVRAGYAAIPAADAMGEAFSKDVKARLTEKSHARGTRTPAAAGGPPAAESGALAASVAMVPASTPVVATASVAPHLPPRDAVQEWGLGNIRPTRFQYMHFWYDGERWEKRVDVPSRSYMRTTVAIMVADGSLSRAAAEAFYASMWG